MTQNDFRDFELRGWNDAADRYHLDFEALTRQSIPSMIDAAAVTGATRVLDICTGPGYAAEAAAARGAEVTGIDFSAQMVDLARSRLPHIDFRQADAELLPLADETVDAVTIGFGLLHLGEPEKALAEAHRVLRTGGRIAATVWAAPDRVIGFGVTLDAVKRHGTTDVGLPPAPDFFRFSDAEESRRVFEDAGFETVHIEEVPQSWHIDRAGDLFDVMMNATVRTSGLLKRQSADAVAAIKRYAEDALRPYTTTSGIALPMPAMLIAATKP